MSELVIDAKTGEIRQAGTHQAGEIVQQFREMAERDLFVFAKGVLGFNLLNTTFHLQRCRELQEIPPYRKLVLWPRGHLKTTIMKSLTLHLLIQPKGRNVYFNKAIGGLTHDKGTSTRILLASKAAKLAEATLGEIRMIIENNQMLRALWPHCFWEDTKHALAWNNQRLFLPRDDIFKEASIETIGVGGQITGYHFNVHLLDDLIDIEDANSPTTMATAIEWFRASRALMDDSKRSLEFTTGTRWAVGDLYEWIIDNDPSVEVTKHAMIEEGDFIFPERYDAIEMQKLQREFGTMFPLLYMNCATDPSLTDFDMSKVRTYRVVNGQIELTEDASDLILANNENRLSAGPKVAPKKGQVVQGARVWDYLAGREAMLKRHGRPRPLTD